MIHNDTLDQYQDISIQMQSIINALDTNTVLQYTTDNNVPIETKEKGINTMRTLIDIKSNSTLKDLHARRKYIKKIREAYIASLKLQQNMFETACYQVLSRYDINYTKYLQHIESVEWDAMIRLKILLRKCKVDIEKTFDQIQRANTNVEMMPKCKEREIEKSYEWDLQLLRLQYSMRSKLNVKVILPNVTPLGRTKYEYESIRNLPASNSTKMSYIQKTNEWLLENGPSFDQKKRIEIKKLVLVAERSSSNKQYERRKNPKLYARNPHYVPLQLPPLLVWPKVLNYVVRNHTWVNNPSSHMLYEPPTDAALSSRYNRSLPQNSNNGNPSTQISPSQQLWEFPCLNCDTPLSSVHLLWLLNPNDAKLADTNIYFKLIEYEAIFQSAKGIKVCDSMKKPNSIPYASNVAKHPEKQKSERILESIRRSLRSVNQNLCLIRREVSKNVEKGSRINPKANPPIPGLLYGRVINRNENNRFETSNLPIESDDGIEIFMQANVLQLLQTIYYKESFLAKLPADKLTFLESMYPTNIFGAAILSTLYIPILSLSNKDKLETRGHSMLALNNLALENLLTMYITNHSYPMYSYSRQDLQYADKDAPSGLLKSSCSMGQDHSCDLRGPYDEKSLISLNGLTRKCCITEPLFLLNQRGERKQIRTQPQPKHFGQKQWASCKNSYEECQNMSVVSKSVLFVEYALVDHLNVSANLRCQSTKSLFDTHYSSFQHLGEQSYKHPYWAAQLTDRNNLVFPLPNSFQEYHESNASKDALTVGSHGTHQILISTSECPNRLRSSSNDLIVELLTGQLNQFIQSFFSQTVMSMSSHFFHKSIMPGIENITQECRESRANYMDKIEKVSSLLSIEKRLTSELETACNILYQKGDSTYMSSLFHALQNIPDTTEKIRFQMDLRTRLDLAYRKLKIIRYI